MRLLFKRLIILCLPRYKSFTTTYPGFKCKALDKFSFLSMIDSIFSREIYYFKSEKNNPFIIDCGANIGISTIYFKRLFPEAEVIAFEPFSLAIEAFKFNTLKLKNITLIENGLASSARKCDLLLEGSDGCKIVSEGYFNTCSIYVEPLSPYINKEVDFLKIDIEGSEFEVLKECKNKLNYVKRMFVEYHARESTPYELESILSIIREAGFKYYLETDSSQSKNPFVNINNRLGFTMFINIFCYRTDIN